MILPGFLPPPIEPKFTRVRSLYEWPKSDISDFGWGEGVRMRKRRVRDSLLDYSPNTNSMEAVDVCLSSGAFGMIAFGCLEPTSTATYCLPLTE